MRYSYGIMDRSKILLYNPQLFLKGNDILVFPSKDFHQWHGEIKEYIDGLYQINARNMDRSEPINLTEFNLAIGVINNITEELKHLFDPKKESDLSYHYISTPDEKYKKRNSSYTSDMRRCDIRIPVITPGLKYQNLIEIIRYAEIRFERTRRRLKG
jgi:hypothetical protein